MLLFKTVRRAIAVIVLVPLLVVLGTAFKVWWVARHDEHPRSDAIVVLGASQFDGRPSTVFRSRLDHAISLWEQGVAPRVVTVGGGRPGDRFTEGAAGARYLREHGVTSVVALGTGSDTLQSVKAVARELDERGWHSAVIVTDPWHCLRSR
ncbi:MAG TPA: YdcF family protein, partial [Mycobacteriales bacterium]|nr:YdcF family protein [Mycobacteriales bacterium]